MPSRALAVSLALALCLGACNEAPDGRQVSPDAKGGGEQRTGSVPQAGFGGVVEVTFSTEDTAVQDAVAAGCGFRDGRLSELAAAPPALPPRVRWFPKPPDLAAATACLERQQDVLRVLLPL